MSLHAHRHSLATVQEEDDIDRRRRSVLAATNLVHALRSVLLHTYLPEGDLSTTDTHTQSWLLLSHMRPSQAQVASNLSREMQREQLDEAIGDKPAKHAQARQQVKEMLICKGEPRLMCHMQLATTALTTIWMRTCLLFRYHLCSTLHLPDTGAAQ